MGVTMAGKAPSERTVRALLDKYGCAVPYHEVRTRFLGNIASPIQCTSPMPVIKDLWGGKLPAFDNIEALNELLDALVNGLWNDLTRHQKPDQRFYLTSAPKEPNAENLGQYGLIRLQELEGFIHGLFNGKETIDLPERAHRAVKQLSELRAMMGGICELVSRGTNVDDHTQIATTFKHLRELTQFMETEIHEAVLSCTRAHHQMLDGIVTQRPTVH
jgi:hypothetical protein